MKQDILSGKIPLMVADSGAKSSCGRVNDTFIRTEQPSTKMIHTPLGRMAQALETAHLHHKVRAYAQRVNIVP